MKKVLFLILTSFLAFGARAQMITDTVSIGASYANQVWYSMPNGIQKTDAQSNWDIAFDADTMGFAIAINSAAGTMVWKYPKSDTSGWGSIDTAGINGWQARWNSVKDWHFGAMGRYYKPSIPGDVDWGIYDMTTHTVTGDSLYILKLADGEYKKLWVASLIGTTYTFKYADLDGTNMHLATLNKKDFTGKNLCYYSLQTDSQLDREPLSANWDLVFTTYTALLPTPHTEAGVLANENMFVAKYSGVANVDTFEDCSKTSFQDSINVIGYDWKTGSGSSYTVKDSLVYFIGNQKGDVWKLVFRGFGGSANGDYIFSKKLLFTTSVSNKLNVEQASMALYPNPSIGTNCHIVYTFNANHSAAMVLVSDITGKRVFTGPIPATRGLHQYLLPICNMQPGTYVLTIVAEGIASMQQKLIVQ